MGSEFSVLADNISIEFDKQYSSIYQTGETVSGKVEFLNNAQVELKLKNIIIELVGNLVYTTSRGSGHSRTTDIHAVPFFTEKQIVRSANKEDSFILESGNHTWPFALHLADSLPPTLEQTRYNGPYVRYVVRVQLVVPQWYKKNIQQTSFITVHSLSSSMPTIKSQDNNKNRKDVHLEAFLQNNVAVSGKNVSLDLDLHNPTHVTIIRVSLTLIQQRLLGPAGKEDIVVLKKDLNGIQDFQGEHLHNKFEFQLPTNIPSTYSCTPPQWSARKPLEVNYELHLEAHIAGFFTNVELRLPITVTNNVHEVVSEKSSLPSYEKLFVN